VVTSKVPALFAPAHAGEHLQDDGSAAALHLQLQLIGFTESVV
jgi:hypothetical protein